MSPVSRTLYTGLVSAIEAALPDPTRRDGSWRTFRDFGREGEHRYVVEMDLTSCYELVNHVDLLQELMLRSFDKKTTHALSALLRDVGHRGRGIPQMLESSDRLADAYLSVIDRKLMRQGWKLMRYADDYRVLADDWQEANRIIEFTSAAARALGLILSTSKTIIVKRQTLNEAEELSNQNLSHRLQQEADDMDIDDYHWGGEYVSQPANIAEAGHMLVEHWHGQFVLGADVVEGDRKLLRRALVAATDHSEAIEPELLNDLVFESAPRLEWICEYLLRRTDGDDYRNATLGLLMKTVGNSPWSKIWLLHVAESVVALDAEFLEWIVEQASDAHEVVRAQAVWVLACRGALETTLLQEVYSVSTEISGPSLAACAAMQGKIDPSSPISPQVISGVRNDGNLNPPSHG